jgi:hypothetical protein
MFAIATVSGNAKFLRRQNLARVCHAKFSRRTNVLPNAAGVLKK